MNRCTIRRSLPLAWLLLAALMGFGDVAPALAQQGAGPKCDFQFIRNARRRARVCVCFQRVDGSRQLCCIDVDGVVDPVPPGLPTTPAEMAAAMCAAINACPPPGSLVCMSPGAGIVCTMAGDGTPAIKLWTVVTRDGTGGLLRNVGPGPTDPQNPDGPPPPPPPGFHRLAPMVQLIGTPVSPALVELEAFGGPYVSAPIAVGTTMDQAAQQFTAALNGSGYSAVYQGTMLSMLGDMVAVIELRALPVGAVPEKLLVLSYDEDAPGASSLGFGVELAEAPLPSPANLTTWGRIKVLYR